MMAQRRPVQSRVVRPAPAEGPLSNPLKGWAAYSHEWSTYALPARMTYQYVSWRELEPERGVYRFAEWEREKWDSPNARGKHVVFRLYLDYPNLPVGVPQWVIDRGVAMRPYDIPEIGIRDPWRNAPDIQFANRLLNVNGWNVVDIISG
jgi:hypothetical protein